MSRIESWTIDGADGEPIHGDTHLPDGEAGGVLIICHGFKGYKDYGFFPYLAEQATAGGLIAHRFNFSHSGMTNNVAKFERPDLFEKDTWGKQIQDLQNVARAVEEGRLPGEGSQLPQVWFGHSRGGVTVILAAARAARAAGAVAPAGVVTASAPDAASNLDADQRRRLRQRGVLESPSSRTGQVLRVGVAWLNEIDASPEDFDPVRQIQHFDCPVLVLHGNEDPTVPASAADMLASSAGSRAEKHIITGAQHTFNCPNPLEGEPPAETREMAQRVVAFATRICGG